MANSGSPNEDGRVITNIETQNIRQVPTKVGQPQ